MPASRSIEEIQAALVKYGATGVLYEYEQGTGRILALKFILPMHDKEAANHVRNVGFSLPVNWRRFQAALKRDGVRRWDDEDYCYRVAWRCVRDWVLAQMALYDTQMVDLPQVFLPFAASGDGETLYDKVAKGGFLLGPGN